MKIGFYAQGEGDHLRVARYLIDSAKDVMPGVEVFHLTDGTTPEVAGSTPLRIAERMPMGVRRIKHYSLLDGEWCFVDSDVVFKRDVREVFDKPFDVALASRIGTYMENTPYGEAFPYNFGVVFSKTKAVWQQLLFNLVTMPLDQQHWGGEQELLCHMVRQPMSHFSAEILSSDYNFTPKSKDEDVSGKAIVHYKGLRKAWIMTPQLAR